MGKPLAFLTVNYEGNPGQTFMRFRGKLSDFKSHWGVKHGRNGLSSTVFNVTDQDAKELGTISLTD